MEATPKNEKQGVAFMSKIVARMQKMKTENLIGIGNHNQRKTKNHSNKDIDVDRSHLNYDLVNRTENYKVNIQKFIDETKSTERAIRKDAVLVNEWIITSDQGFFENLSEEEGNDFFEKAKDYFADKFGEKNIRYATVHLDETTPHMHLGIVPFDKENKLSAKRVFGRQALRDVQEELPKKLEELGFNIERGEKGSRRKNLTVPEYKALQTEMKEQEKELENVQKRYRQAKEKAINTKQEWDQLDGQLKEVKNFGVAKNKVKEIKRVTAKRGFIGDKTVKYEMTPEQFEKMESMALAGIQEKRYKKEITRQNKKDIKKYRKSSNNWESKYYTITSSFNETERERAMYQEKYEKLDERFENLIEDKILYESLLKDMGKADLSMMSELEKNGRLVIDNLERDLYPESKEECQLWIKILEDNKNEKTIPKTRLDNFLEKLKNFLNRILGREQEEKREKAKKLAKQKQKKRNKGRKMKF